MTTFKFDEDPFMTITRIVYNPELIMFELVMETGVIFDSAGTGLEWNSNELNIGTITLESPANRQVSVALEFPPTAAMQAYYTCWITTHNYTLTTGGSSFPGTAIRFFVNPRKVRGVDEFSIRCTLPHAHGGVDGFSCSGSGAIYRGGKLSNKPTADFNAISVRQTGGKLVNSNEGVNLFLGNIFGIRRAAVCRVNLKAKSIAVSIEDQ